MEIVSESQLLVAGRLDRLPIVSFHRRIMFTMAVAFFFEFGDINTFSFAAPAVMNTWGLSISTVSIIMSATFIGMFVGAVTGGFLADNIGRRRGLILTTVWYSGFSLLNIFVWNSFGLFLMRLLTGMGLSAMTVIAITYISEMFPMARRGAYQGWILTLGLLGIPVTGYVARLVVPLASWGWRLVFAWGALGLLIPLFVRQLEESPRWYASRGRLQDADEVLKRMEDQVIAETGSLSPVPPVRQLEERAGRSAEMLQRPYLLRTLMLTSVWIFQTLGFYGFMSWVPLLLVVQGASLVTSLSWSSAMHLGAVPGAILGALLSDRWQRKWWVCLVALAVAACGLVYGITSRSLMYGVTSHRLTVSMISRTEVVVAFGFLTAMLIQTFAPLLYTYTAECYPTRMRSSGAGLAYGTGRLANVAGPLLIAYLFNHEGYGSVFVYIAACWVVVALIVGLAGPRTRGLVLE